MTPKELKQWRERYKLSQEEAAVTVGMAGWYTWSKWERGERRVPGWLPLTLIMLVETGRVKA